MNVWVLNPKLAQNQKSKQVLPIWLSKWGQMSPWNNVQEGSSGADQLKLLEHHSLGFNLGCTRPWGYLEYTHSVCSEVCPSWSSLQVYSATAMCCLLSRWHHEQEDQHITQRYQTGYQGRQHPHEP